MPTSQNRTSKTKNWRNYNSIMKDIRGEVKKGLSSIEKV